MIARIIFAERDAKKANTIIQPKLINVLNVSPMDLSTTARTVIGRATLDLSLLVFNAKMVSIL